MTLHTLLDVVPLPLWLSFVSATLIPELSALVTKRPGWWTGVATVVLSVAGGFFSEWAASPSGFDWKVALATAAATWFAASKWHSKVLANTIVEAFLHAAFGGDPTMLQAKVGVDGAHRVAALEDLPTPTANSGAGSPTVRSSGGADCATVDAEPGRRAVLPPRSEHSWPCNTSTPSSCCSSCSPSCRAARSRRPS